MIRTNYDIVAPKNADMFADQLAEVPVDRAMLGIFAELVGPGTVGDLGCGPDASPPTCTGSA